MTAIVHDLPAIPQFPGSDPMGDPDPAAFALAALEWLSPSQVAALGGIDPEFAPVAAAVLGMDAIWNASAP